MITQILSAEVATIVIHEAGHVLASATLGVKVKRIGITWHGPYIVRNLGADWQNAVISLAGPLANLLAAYLTLRFYARLGQPWPFVLLNLGFGFYNLLPIPLSDGLRVLKLALRWSRKGGKHEQSASFVSQ